MVVRFPDTMGEDTRWQTAFVETGEGARGRQLYALGDDLQCIWWQDGDGAPMSLLPDGPTPRKPVPEP